MENEGDDTEAEEMESVEEARVSPVPSLSPEPPRCSFPPCAQLFLGDVSKKGKGKKDSSPRSLIIGFSTEALCTFFFLFYIPIPSPSDSGIPLTVDW